MRIERLSEQRATLTGEQVEKLPYGRVVLHANNGHPYMRVNGGMVGLEYGTYHSMIGKGPWVEKPNATLVV